MQQQARRLWLKQSLLAAAGISMGSQLFGRNYQCDEPLIYTGPADHLIKIGSNENPYGPSPLAVAAMQKAVASSNRYPWEITTQLRKKIGSQYGLTEAHVLMGAGSSELLGLVSAYAGRNKGNVVTGYPTFKLWFTAAENFGLQIKKVPLTNDKVHNLPAMLQAMDANTQMMYIVNPHNPTGTIVAKDALQNFIEEASKKALVLLDEAYTEYSDEPSLGHLVANNKNLVVAKTFSKIHGMAGARIGYILAHPDTIKALSAWQPWSNAGAGTAALAGALASIDDLDFQKSCRQKNDAVKALVLPAMQQLGIQVIPSYTNFIYYNTSNYPADVAAITQAAGISGVRIFEEGTNWRRTSIGTMDEMKKFIEVLNKAAK
jgi:histidinol-phosphate aminotransferase